MEVWKQIEGYDNYMVSNQGRVKSLKNGKEKVLKCCKYKDEYLSINLCKNGKQKIHKIHRLVAEAFIPNPDNKPCIDHINTDKNDNRVDNLRWVTHKENSNNPLTINKWKIKIGKLHHNHKPILQFSLDGEFIRKWDCACDIQRELGFNQSNISSCCLGKRTKAGGFIWGFEKDYELIPFKVFDLKIYKKVA